MYFPFQYVSDSEVSILDRASGNLFVAAFQKSSILFRQNFLVITTVKTKIRTELHFLTVTILSSA